MRAQQCGAVTFLQRFGSALNENRYFLMGDNRDNSNDSRGWGTAHRDQLKVRC